MANDLNKLNDILFQTLQDVQDGKIDEKKAQIIVNLGNSIVNNAKTQLSAFKATRGGTGVPLLPSGEEADRPKVLGTDMKVFTMRRPAAEQEVAAQNGYKNVAEAVVAMGKEKFRKAVDQIIQDEHAA
jgi:hypothetical protein